LSLSTRLDITGNWTDGRTHISALGADIFFSFLPNSVAWWVVWVGRGQVAARVHSTTPGGQATGRLTHNKQLHRFLAD